MDRIPKFPDFIPLRLNHRFWFDQIFEIYKPETSELTFTNFYIWRKMDHPVWCMDRDWLIVMGRHGEGRPFLYPPVGPRGRGELVHRLFDWMVEEKRIQPCIERSDLRLAEEIAGDSAFSVFPNREHFDYVYRSDDLIRLAGRKYHSKRNHISQITARTPWEYRPLEQDMVPICLRLIKEWCAVRKCSENSGMRAECQAVHNALFKWKELGLSGGVIYAGGGIRAFSLGQRLNENTAVIHIEKADPEYAQMYAVINQQFCLHAWKSLPFINREQDLGAAGLRKAKESYHPHRLVEKYRICRGDREAEP